jgi:hypothetical protein
MSDSNSSSTSQDTRNAQKGSSTNSITDESRMSEASYAASTESRDELVSKAETFLRTPSVGSQGIAEKREFLLGKGLTGEEVERLLQEVVSVVYWSMIRASNWTSHN